MNPIYSALTFAQEAANTAAEAATAATEAAPAASAPSPFSSLWIFIPIFGIMYFLMIRPQQKKQKQIQEMLRQLKVGDKVMTSSGALGTLTKVTEKTVRINFGGNNEVDYVRAAVAEIINETTEAAADAKK